MLRIYDGRNEFFQWDLNQKLIITDMTVKEVHFYNKNSEAALVCEVRNLADDLLVVDVPNILLQDVWPIKACAHCEHSATKEAQVFNIVARSKPADYVYTETEIRTWEDHEERLTALEAGGGAGGSITLDKIPMGINLRGKTIYFDTTYVYDGSEDASLAIDFENGASLYGDCYDGEGGSALDVYFNMDEVCVQITDPETFEWLMDSFTFPDDQDYIVMECYSLAPYVSGFEEYIVIPQSEYNEQLQKQHYYEIGEFDSKAYYDILNLNPSVVCYNGRTYLYDFNGSYIRHDLPTSTLFEYYIENIDENVYDFVLSKEVKIESPYNQEETFQIYEGGFNHNTLSEYYRIDLSGRVDTAKPLTITASGNYGKGSCTLTFNMVEGKIYPHTHFDTTGAGTLMYPHYIFSDYYLGGRENNYLYLNLKHLSLLVQYGLKNTITITYSTPANNSRAELVDSTSRNVVKTYTELIPQNLVYEGYDLAKNVDVLKPIYLEIRQAAPNGGTKIPAKIEFKLENGSLAGYFICGGRISRADDIFNSVGLGVGGTNYIMFNADTIDEMCSRVVSGFRHAEITITYTTIADDEGLGFEM